MTALIVRADARRLPIAAGSVDTVCTDPPYELGFMGRSWDASGVAYDVDMWRGVLRALKPGGHLLAFGGTRTSHRMVCAIEDAGFEVRDSITWLYGSGFAKSWNFNTQYTGTWCGCNPLPYSHASDPDLHGMRPDIHPPAITRRAGEGTDLFTEVQRGQSGPGLGDSRTQGSRGVVGRDGGGVSQKDQGRGESLLAGRELHRRQGLPADPHGGSPKRATERLRPGARAGDGADDRTAGGITGGGPSHQRGPSGQPAGESEALPEPHGALDDGALRDGSVCTRCGGLDSVYGGFGTGIKPASEPIVVARKPLDGTVAQTVLKHGTGALNISACRVKSAEPVQVRGTAGMGYAGSSAQYELGEGRLYGTAGRWPSNVVLSHAATPDGEDLCGEGCVPGCPVADLDAQSGTSVSRVGKPRRAGAGSGWGMTATGAEYDDSGAASRFFPVFRYQAKADAAERPRVDGVSHPTVKPLELMRWLVRLVTPPGGLVLDPFAGSGTTVEACLREGFRAVAVELDEPHLPLIQERVRRARTPWVPPADVSPDGPLTLFDGAVS